MNLDPHNVRTQIENLKAIAPECWDEDEDTLLNDMLAAETNLMEFLQVVEDRRQHALTMAGALATRIAEHEIRQKRYETQEQQLRKLALSLMQQAGLTRAELPEATYSIRKGWPRVVVVDEAAVPDELCKIERKPDKTKIREFINGGELPNWAVREIGADSIAIRTK